MLHISRRGQNLGTVLTKYEGLLGLGAHERRVPGECLGLLYLLLRPWRRDDFPRRVASHPSLVVIPPSFGEADLGVEATAILEGLGQSTSLAGRLLPHAAQDLTAGCLTPGRLRVRLLEVDHTRKAYEESAALGADDEHSLLSQGHGLRDRRPVAYDALLGGGKQNGREHAALEERRR